MVDLPRGSRLPSMPSLSDSTPIGLTLCFELSFMKRSGFARDKVFEVRPTRKMALFLLQELEFIVEIIKINLSVCILLKVLFGCTHALILFMWYFVLGICEKCYNP